MPNRLYMPTLGIIVVDSINITIQMRFWDFEGALE